MSFFKFLYENPNFRRHLLAVLALIIRNLLFILEEFSNSFSAFSSADKTALAEHSNCRYFLNIFARPYPVISKKKN
jgi:hypothetical protein